MLDEATWSTALPDWEDRIVNRKSMIPDLPLFKDQADLALRVFKRLRVPDMIGTPTYGAVCQQWVFDFVRAVFGAFDPETNKRMIREFFLLIPKKNGKTSIAAAIMVTAAIINVRPAAELLLVAPTKTVAAIAFKQAAGIVSLDEELTKVFSVHEHIKTIKHRTSKAVLEIKAADTDAVTGSKATFVLIDETHEFSTKSKAHAVFVEVRGSLAARPDGFLMQITTQSKEAPAGVFKTELEKARAVRDGKLVLPILAVLYELPEAMSENGGWMDPKTWGMVNPNLGQSVDPKFLEDELIAAKHEGPAQLALIASQHFNVEVGVGLKAQSWTGAQFWARAEEPSLVTLDELLARCEVAVVGIDGGGLDDLLAAAVVGREIGTRRWLTWAHAWAHPEVFEQRKDIAPRLLDFEAAGCLTICREPTADIMGVADVVEQVANSGLLPEAAGVGLDPYGVSAIVDELAMRGIPDEVPVAIGQGARLSPAIWGMERKLKDGTLVHAVSPLMDWVMGNAKTEQRGSAVLLTKETAGKAKIDPLIATLNGFTLMTRNPDAGQIGTPWDRDPDYRMAG